MSRLRVDVWSDIACPWCWVGKRHLEVALARFPHPVEVVWRAFELDPAAPRALAPGVDAVERLARKYGVSRAAAQGMIDRMVAVGAADGLDFRFDRLRPGNTFDAHRLLAWAAGRGRQGALVERLMLAYMHEGRSVADHDELVALAVDAGLPGDEARAVLDEGRHADQVRADEALAAELGITGVPFFVLGGRHAVSGAQPTALLEQALALAWDDPAAREPLSSRSADACGPEGCPVPAR